MSISVRIIIMQIFSRVVILLTFFPGLLQAEESVNWQTLVSEDPVSQKLVCLMVSNVQQIRDGQTTSPVQITYNGSLFFLKTDSNIDLSYPKLGLQVDNKALHPIGRVYKKTNVLFEDNVEQLRDEFIRGLNVKLTLGFWPTWPKTRAYEAHFNLKGFTKAYHQLLHCQKTGEAP